MDATIIQDLNNYLIKVQEYGPEYKSLQLKTTDKLSRDFKLIFESNIPELLYKIFPEEKYIISASVGKGFIAACPWIAIMDMRETKTTQSGVYLVFLFSEDLQDIYLSLIQGVKKSKKEDIISKRNEIRNALNITDDLFVKRNEFNIKNKDYQSASIYTGKWDYTSIEKSIKLLSVSKKAYETYIKQTKIAFQAIEYNDDNHPTLYPALRTKPFILLAGISGSGKSRLVRELAFATCPDIGDLRSSETEPGNYCIIEVKPNWHDSTEILGYESALKEKYIFTRFTRFIVKAMKYPNVPFFLCLDEMNLAPVEQYFAEYLSVLETRRRDSNGKINTGALINPKVFNRNGNSESFNQSWMDELDLDENKDGRNSEIVRELKKNGLRLPQNLIVIGTVNMDDTTHQFSKKVIDRAMTIEMNGGDFSKMFEITDSLNYRDVVLPPESVLSQWTTANEVLSAFPDFADDIISKVPLLLGELNEQLKNTPFQVAYRIQNELIIYIGSLKLDHENENKNIDELITMALDAIMMMKVLPRIEGDEDMLDHLLPTLSDWAISKGLQESAIKIEEMQQRLKIMHFSSFWP